MGPKNTLGIILHPYIQLNTLIQNLRSYFLQKSCVEVSPHLCQESVCLEPFLDTLHLNTNSKRKYLITSPEFQLKKYLAFDPNTTDIFSITSSFRQEQLSNLHAHEFFMLEYYLRNFDYQDQANFFLEMVNSIHPGLYLQQEITTISFASWFYQCSGSHWPRAATSLDNYLNQCLEVLFDVMKQVHSYADVTIFQKEKLLIELLSVYLDKNISSYAKENFQNTFWCLKDFPIILQGMSVSNINNYTCKRLEVYYQDIEIGNAYQELFQIRELQQIWSKNNQMRKLMQKPIHHLDETLVELTPKMQGISGMAIGVERLVMVLLKKESITDFYL